MRPAHEKARVPLGKAIYLPAYSWVIENRLNEQLEQLRALADEGVLVLLDYETNEEVEDTSKPLSHAGLVKRWLTGEWPE
ncbi:MAG: hypothetical protein H8E37_02990 [Planctomycetes bacterium]|nr:hypothetical protein [Planctomycetota bacterium]